MTTEKILEVVTLYRKRFETEKVHKERMDLFSHFSFSNQEVAKRKMLEHAYYLLDGVEEFARNPDKIGKTNRHLGSIQTLLLISGWYTLDELMNHNRPD